MSGPGGVHFPRSAYGVESPRGRQRRPSLTNSVLVRSSYRRTTGRPDVGACFPAAFDIRQFPTRHRARQALYPAGGIEPSEG